MPPARSSKYAKPAPNLTAVILAVTAVLTVAAVLTEMPAGIVLWAGFLVAAWMYPAPMLTGTRGAAANEYEERQQQVYGSWIRARSGLMLLAGSGWRPLWPGLPMRTGWLAALGCGLVVGALPLSADLLASGVERLNAAGGYSIPVPTQIPGWMHLVSGYLTMVTCCVMTARSEEIHQRPAATFPSPATMLASSRLRTLGSVPVALSGAGAGAWVAGNMLGMEASSVLVLAIGSGVLAAWGMLAAPAADVSLGPWRLVKEATDEWNPRFESIFKAKEGIPRIISREIVGDGIIVDTMDAPSGVYANGMLDKRMPLEAASGAGVSVTVLNSPNLDGQGQPVPGSVHHVRVRVVSIPDGCHPNLLDPNLPEDLVFLKHEIDMADAMDSIGFARPPLLSVEQVMAMPEKVIPVPEKPSGRTRGTDTEQSQEQVSDTDAGEGEGAPSTPEQPGALKRAIHWVLGIVPPEPVYPDDSPCAVWSSTWNTENGPSLKGIRTEGVEAVSAMASRGSEDTVDVAIEHRSGRSFVLIGDPLAHSAEFVSSVSFTPQDVRNAAAEQMWNKRWTVTLPQGQLVPTPRFEITREVELPMRFGKPLVLHEQLFATLEGQDAQDTYIDPPKSFESAMKAAIPRAQFVSIVGMRREREPLGTRHSVLFLVRYSEDSVPQRPQEVAPPEQRVRPELNGSAWVLAHLVNQAFMAKAVRLPKPELADVECLTLPESSKHVWKMKLALYGATTLADVRKKADAIQAQLGCPWLRVREDDRGELWLYMGDPSGSARFRRGGETEVSNLDFEQAWLDASIKNRSGRTPQLRKMAPLETNPEISVLDFELPAGIDFQRVKSAKKGLSAAFKAEFVEVTKAGANGVRMFMSKEDPLPTRVGVPFENMPESPGGFAVNALGEQVVWDPSVSPHLLVLGGTGAGKSAAISVILHSLVRRGFQPVIIDPTKGGYDFLFCQDWAIAPFGQSPYEAASIMRAVYGELERRKALNGKHGVVHYTKVPAEERPSPIVVVVDEFTSLIGRASVPPRSDDPEAEAAREEIVAENNARANVALIVGKLAREARSVGIHLVLGTQKLPAKVLDSMPGGADLKALALDTRVPVPVSEKFPDGWATVELLDEGDEVYARDGQIVPVAKVTETFLGRRTYRVTFDDGQSVVTDGGHLWNVSSERSRTNTHPNRQARASRLGARVARLRAMAKAHGPGVLASAEDIASETGMSAWEVRKAIRGLGLLTYLVSSDRRAFCPEPMKVGTTASIFRVSEVASALGMSCTNLPEFATARRLLAELGEASPSSYRVWSFAQEIEDLGATRVETLADRHVDIAEFATRYADELESSGRTAPTMMRNSTMTTEQILGAGLEKSWAVDVAAADGPDVNLPVDPYVLGIWLGDGSTGSGVISSGFTPPCTDQDGVTVQEHLIRRLDAAGYSGHRLRCHPVLVGTYGLAPALRGLGVLKSKHIPAAYLRASRAQRLELLRGFMDADGSLNSSGRCTVVQARAALATQLAELVRSLGWKATEFSGTYSGTTRYGVSFKADVPVFHLPRKAAKQNLSTNRASRRRIVSIEPVDSVPTKCLAVDHPSHEFLIEGFIPTHNTNLARMVLGNMTLGDKQSALRNWQDAEEVPNPQVGRGLFEAMDSPHPKLIQAWFEPNDVLKGNLISEGVPVPPPEGMLDPEDPRFKVSPPEEFVEVVEEDEVIVEEAPVEEVDLGLSEIDLGEELGLDLSEFSDDTEPEPHVLEDVLGPEPEPASDPAPEPSIDWPQEDDPQPEAVEPEQLDIFADDAEPGPKPAPAVEPDPEPVQETVQAADDDDFDLSFDAPAPVRF